MSINFIAKNLLMNQPIYNQDININMVKQALINQLSQQCILYQMNLLANSCYKNMQNNYYQNNIRNDHIISYGKKRNKFTQPYSYNIQNNEFLSKLNLCLQEETLRNNFILNQYRTEALKNNYKANIQENTVAYKNTNINASFNTEKSFSKNESQKETKIINDENMSNKEDDDFDEMSNLIIPNNRRFSQKSKRSDNSDNSIFSKSTQDTSNEIQIYNSKKDVSIKDDKNLIKNEEIEDKHKTNPAFENTVILCVKVKISENNTAIFKLKRFDDIFLTIQYFCEINNLDEKYIKPLIIKSLCAINTIYKVMNCEIDQNNLEVLKEVKQNI